MGVMLHPSVIKQSRHAPCGYGQYHFLDFVARWERKPYECLLARKIIEHRAFIACRVDFNAVDRGDYCAGNKLGGGSVKRSSGHNLGHFEAVAVKAHVIEKSQLGGGVGAGARTVPRACMRHVELSEQLAEHLGKVIVVVDVGEETAIGGGHGRPVDTVHVLVVEPLGLLAGHEVKHVLPLGCRVELHACRVADRSDFFARKIHFFHRAATEQEQVFPVGIGLQ